MAAVILVGLVIAPAGQAALVSQGGVRMGADALWSHGVLGDGQTVAILDEGFAGLDRSIALGELPPREAMTIRAFDPVGGLDGSTEFGQPTQHGVRMAEIVHDIAPDAHLALVAYRTPEQFEQAAAWIAAEGIPIVSHSNSFLTPPFDGDRPRGPGGGRRRGGGRALGELGGQLRPAPLARHALGRRGGHPDRPRAGLPLLFSLAWSSPAVAASVAVERLDAAGAWVEVQRSAPVAAANATSPGPMNATTTPLFADGSSYRLVVREEGGPPCRLTSSRRRSASRASPSPTAASPRRATRRAPSPSAP